jgi:cell division transport system permease protein
MMARLGYFFRETSVNIRRNITLTVAAVLTVAVAVVFVGGAVLFRKAVETATTRWQGGVEFIIFLDPDIPGEQADSIGKEITSHPDVKKVEFFDKDRAYQEFVDFFPDFADTVEPERLPESYRVIPQDASEEVIASLAGQFEVRPGVFQVVSAQESVGRIRRFGAGMNTGLLVLAIVVSVASVLLIYNSIRVAIFARRREIEVMKLVGATNSFIRFPFILEGMVHGFFGALVGTGLLAIARPWVEDLLTELQGIPIFSDLQITSGQFNSTVIWVVACGLLFGAVGSGVAAGRFLDV